MSRGRPSHPRHASGHAGRLRPIVLVLLVIAGGVLAWRVGLHGWVRPERLTEVRTTIESSGVWGPVLFIAGYVVAELLFVPGLPLTILSGLVFGPAWGILYAWIAATLAAALAFLIARHLARATVEQWIRTSPRLARFDAAVQRHGWRILVVTRLVPLFPFNLQNFAYGLTRIRFWTYIGLSAVCVLPGTVAFTLAGGALSGGGSPARVTWTLALAGLLIVLVSLAPRWVMRRSPIAGELLGTGRSKRLR